MTKKKEFVTYDGNNAASYIAYMFSEVAAIYPITPSSTMAEYVDEWSARGRKNIFGEIVKVVEMQSEAGAAGAVHGSLQAGALTTTFTASQGLLLMIPNMYKISGELLPGVFHVSARSLAAQALSIFGDHSDVMSTRQTGFAMLATGSVQEIMDLAGVAHLAAIKSRIPFLHFFDGFRTSAEVQKIELIQQQDLEKLIDRNALQAFRNRALNPENPVTRGTAQNPDIYFQTREVANRFYDALPDIVEYYMNEISLITGRQYRPFNYYGAPDAEHIVIAMGSITETTREVVEYLNASGKKTGLLAVHLYRPFSEKHFFNVLPKTVKRIAVLDRTKEPGANGEPLYLDVKDLFYGRKDAPIIVGGRYGLSSKDTTPSHVLAVFENLDRNEPKNRFTLGIVDDVTFHSLPLTTEIDVLPAGTFSGKFYGVGSDGTVGANKNSIMIIGDNTEKYAQGYFAYDSKKSGGVTVSHLRFGDQPIRAPYFVKVADFVACHVPSYLGKYDMLNGLKKGGTFLLNSLWDAKETKKRLPDDVKKYLAENRINLYIINATKIAAEIGLGNRTNTIMQAAFFSIANVIPYDTAVEQMKKFIIKSFGTKGEEIVNMNFSAVDRGGEPEKVDIPEEWATIKLQEGNYRRELPEFIRNVVEPINSLKGDDLPVSAFLGREDGTFPAGTTAYEKRGIAVEVPEWIASNCIQCNQCAYVCPHASIRPFLLNEEEMKILPEGTATLKAIPKTFDGLQFRIQISPLDCTGCGNCVDVCPAKSKALVFKPLDEKQHDIKLWELISEKVSYKDSIVQKDKSVKNSQFAQPLFEFSGACAGCGETPYIKLITQLYGDRMIIANATGCSSIFGGSAPSTSYTVNAKGHGPAWANSLFEDNAEFGYGLALGVNKLRERISLRMQALIQDHILPETKTALAEWIEAMHDSEKSQQASEKVIAHLQNENNQMAQEILSLKQYLVKKSIWVFGGDGWAYDIGFGGLDHVIASGDDINLLVLDTEVYSNTGGQSSKATPIGAVAKFASIGKRIRKKDLSMMAMSYGYVYVAQIAMGANQAQTLRAIREAENYKGPSLIIAYSPCIAHGIIAGMGMTQREADLAVKCGYWVNFRYNPMLEAEGKNPLEIDSKEPDWSKFKDFLDGEIRYAALKKAFPKEAAEMIKAAEDNARWRYNAYKRLSAM